MFVYRSAQPSDVGRMAEMNCRLARETEGKELDEVMVLAGVRRGLELAPEVRYFVAESHSGIVGHVMITREWSDWRNGWMVWLQSEEDLGRKVADSKLGASNDFSMWNLL